MQKPFLILWVLLLYVGSLIAQFASLSLALEITSWSLLFVIGVILSPSLVKRSQSGLFLFYLGLAFVYLASLLLLFGPPIIKLSSPSRIYLFWHLVLLGGYLYASRLLRIPRLIWFTLLGLSLTPLYLYSPLSFYQPLIFGLVHSALLLFIIV